MMSLLKINKENDARPTPIDPPNKDHKTKLFNLTTELPRGTLAKYKSTYHRTTILLISLPNTTF